MFRKKKKALFGANVEPDCALCQANGAKQGETPLCALGRAPKNGKCKKYIYDPLRREPRPAPPLRTERYTKEDFEL